MRNPYEDDFHQERGCPSKCQNCDEEAVAEVIVQTSGPVALCGDCLDQAITTCPGCDNNIWQKDGYRIYLSANLYCSRCAKQNPAVAAGLERALKADEARDDVNQVRR